jgi:hypothetical protein
VETNAASAGLSAYEIERLNNIARNNETLRALGLDKAALIPGRLKHASARKSKPVSVRPSIRPLEAQPRKSARLASITLPSGDGDKAPAALIDGDTAPADVMLSDTCAEDAIDVHAVAVAISDDNTDVHASSSPREIQEIEPQSSSTSYPDVPPHIYPKCDRSGSIVGYYVQIRIRCKTVDGGYCRTLEEAKSALSELLAKHPEHKPKPRNYRQNKGKVDASFLLGSANDDSNFDELPREYNGTELHMSRENQTGYCGVVKMPSRSKTDMELRYRVRHGKKGSTRVFTSKVEAAYYYATSVAPAKDTQQLERMSSQIDTVMNRLDTEDVNEAALVGEIDDTLIDDMVKDKKASDHASSLSHAPSPPSPPAMEHDPLPPLSSELAEAHASSSIPAAVPASSLLSLDDVFAAFARDVGGM